jgi:hypothetical protein
VAKDGRRANDSGGAGVSDGRRRTDAGASEDATEVGPESCALDGPGTLASVDGRREPEKIEASDPRRELEADRGSDPRRGFDADGSIDPRRELGEEEGRELPRESDCLPDCLSVASIAVFHLPRRSALAAS